MKAFEEKIEHAVKTEFELIEMGVEEIRRAYRGLATAYEILRKESEVFRSAYLKLEKDNGLLRSTSVQIDQKVYNKKWSWVNKIVFVLKQAQRPLLSSDLIVFMTPLELTLQYSHHKAQVFSAHLNKAVKYGRVIAYKLGGSRGYYYTLPGWYEGDKLKNEFEEKIYFK